MGKREKKWLLLGIILISFCMRGSITAIGALITMIQADLGIEGTLAGLISTVPLIMFALCSLIIPEVAARIGMSRVVFIGLGCMLGGVMVRSWTNLPGVFVGTAAIGIGIATANVLLPSIIKLRFPYQIGLMTGLYTAMMSLFASISAGLSVPLAESGLGWRGSLGVWTVVIGVALVIWLPQLKAPMRFAPHQDADAKHSIYTSPLAWQVSGFMGFQSIVYYSLMAWLPAILAVRGLSAIEAGVVVFAFQVANIPGSFVAPLLNRGKMDQRPIVALFCVCYLGGFLGLALFGKGSLLLLAAACTGLGGGGTFSLAMSFVSYRANSAAEASRLSGMSQTIGYIVAALGPITIGWLYDVRGDWSGALVLLGTALCLMSALGQLAGRDRRLFGGHQRHFDSGQERGA